MTDHMWIYIFSKSRPPYSLHLNRLKYFLMWVGRTEASVFHPLPLNMGKCTTDWYYLQKDKHKHRFFINIVRSVPNYHNFNFNPTKSLESRSFWGLCPLDPLTHLGPQGGPQTPTLNWRPSRLYLQILDPPLISSCTTNQFWNYQFSYCL